MRYAKPVSGTPRNPVLSRVAQSVNPVHDDVKHTFQDDSKYIICFNCAPVSMNNPPYSPFCIILTVRFYTYFKSKILICISERHIVMVHKIFAGWWAQLFMGIVNITPNMEQGDKHGKLDLAVRIDVILIYLQWNLQEVIYCSVWRYPIYI